MANKTFDNLYLKHKGKVSDKWAIYINEYDRIFREYQDKSINILEIGIQNGGSLEIWAKYFRNAQKILGCDINPDCARLEFDDPRIMVLVGDANSNTVQTKVLEQTPEIDIIIDDGSHRSSDIFNSFMMYFPNLTDGGVYVVEDLHCSYWQEYEGGLFDPFSSITFFKRLADIINHEHWGVGKSRSDIISGLISKYTPNHLDEGVLQHIHSVEFINSMCIIRKAKPELNRLGKRFVAGTMEEVKSGFLTLKEMQFDAASSPSQEGNWWSVRKTPPEEEFLQLTKMLIERDARIRSLSTQLDQITKSRGWKIILLIRRARETFVRALDRSKRIMNLPKQVLNILRHDGLIILIKKIKNRLFPSAGNLPSHFDYQKWIVENVPSAEQLVQQQKDSRLFPYRPLISILTPVYNTPEQILRETIHSILDQTYENWELLMVDGGSNEITRKVLETFGNSDPRIKYEHLPKNLGIAENTNVALNRAVGDYIHLLDHDDLLPSYALFEIVKYVNDNPDAEIIYGDEDRISILGERHSPFFKPQWDPILLQAFMYLGHSTYRRELVLSLGGFRSEYDFSQDYDLALRATEVSHHIGHIPKIMYHWRDLPGSAAVGDKPFARQSNIAALVNALRRRGYDANAVVQTTHNQVIYHLKDNSLISIIIPSDNLHNIEKSIFALTKTTGYQNYEILVVTNSEIANSLGPKYRNRNLRFVNYDREYNFSAKCNQGVSHANGEYVLFLNDDVYPVNKKWLEKLIGPFQLPSVGAVAPKMIYTNGTIQHAGLVTGVRNLVGTAFHTFPKDSTYYFNMIQSPRTVSALSAACLLMRREIFFQIGGFDDINTPIMHSDLDLCFKIRDLGLILIYMPEAELTHVGHLSIKEIETNGMSHSPKADIYLMKRWGKYIENDPYFTSNMRDMLYLDSPTKYRMYLPNTDESIKKTPDVLIQTHDLSLSGVPIIAHDQAIDLAEKDCFVTVVSAAPGELVETYNIEKIPVFIDPLILDAPQTLDKFLLNFDIVQANTILAWRLVLTSKRLNIPVLWVIQEGDYGLDMVRNNRNIQTALSVADQVVFSSHQTLIKYRELGSGGNFTSMVFGVEAPFNLLQTQSDNQNKNIRIIHIGSIEERKGQDILLKAIKLLPDNIKRQMDVSFVGRILQRDYYEIQRSESAGLPNVHWIGQLPQDEVWKYVSESDILVCSSRDETGPLVVYQAMCLGKPVISTPVGAVPEIIKHGSNGFVFSLEDSHQLSKLLAKISSDRSLLGKLGAEALITYENKLTKKQSNENMYQMIIALLGQSQKE